MAPSLTKFKRGFRSLRVFEVKMRSRRSFATLPQDGLFHVRRANRLFWQCDVLRFTIQFLISAFYGKSRFSGLVGL